MDERDRPDESSDGCTEAMRLLSAHVPLTLLLDLAGPAPHSEDLLRTEPGDLDWIPALIDERDGGPDHGRTA